MSQENENFNNILEDWRDSDSDEEMPLAQATTILLSSYHVSDTELDNDSGETSDASASADFSNYTQDNSMEVVNVSQDDVILEIDQRDIYRSSPDIDFISFVFIDRLNNTWIFSNINNGSIISYEPLYRIQEITLDDMEDLENTSESTEYSDYIETQSTLQDSQTYEHEELQSTSETSDTDDNMDQSITESMEESWEPDDCPICLEIMLVHGCRTLRCGHTFHKRCISKWFKVVVNCPACRNTKYMSLPDEVCSKSNSLCCSST